MAFGYPISVEVRGRKVVVIGRDAVVNGKADALLEAGARVTVIAEGPQGPLARLKKESAATLAAAEAAQKILESGKTLFDCIDMAKREQAMIARKPALW